MNIAFFVAIIDQIGGTELGTMRLAEQLAHRGHQVTIVTTQAMSQFRQRRSIFDYTKTIHVIRLPVWQRSRKIFARMLTAQALWAFPLFLRDIEILHLRGLTPESISLARIARRMSISTLCVPMASGAYGDVATFPSNISKDPTVFDWVSTLTDSLRAEVINWGIPANKIGVIPNSIDIRYFKPPESPTNKPRVIFVGQFRPEKQIDILLRAWALFQKECPQAHLTLVGGDHSADSYIEMAAHLRISPTFILNTDTAGVLANLQMNSIFVMPGTSEGMSNALLEAMSVGLAPVVADTLANRAVITPEIDGLSYPANSPEALAEQLKRLISDTDLRHRIGTAARKTVSQRFDLESVTEQYLALYTQLLGE
ncbi:MAG: glycosyltransferase family 4 protein [Chloroflexota bacterium]